MLHKEDQLQISVIKYLRLQYPHILAIHVPNGGKRNAREAARLKQMGVVSGACDILIFHPKGDYTYGLFIELKIKPNKPTENQLEFMEKLIGNGWTGGVCYSFDEAQILIDNYLK